MAKRISKIVFCLLAAAALALGCRYLIARQLPRNRYLQQRYGDNFVLTFLTLEPRFNNNLPARWRGGGTSTETFRLTGTPPEELNAADITAEASVYPKRAILSITNTGPEQQKLMYILLEEEFRSEWLLCINGSLLENYAEKSRDQNGIVTLTPQTTLQVIAPGATERVSVFFDGITKWRFQPPKTGHFRAVLLFADGTKYAVEFMR